MRTHNLLNVLPCLCLSKSVGCVTEDIQKKKNLYQPSFSRLVSSPHLVVSNECWLENRISHGKVIIHPAETGESAPLGRFSHRVAMSVCLTVCLCQCLQFFLGLPLALWSHDIYYLLPAIGGH